MQKVEPFSTLFGMVAAIFRQRSRLWLAVLALPLLATSCGSSSPTNAGTTASGSPQPLHVAQSSYGPKPGMHIVGSLTYLNVDGVGSVSFNLSLSNEGTSPYHCSALRATQIPTEGASEQVRAEILKPCSGPAHTIVSGGKARVWFFVVGNGHAPKDIVVLPYASNVGRMVWSVAGCPIIPKACLGPSRQVQH